MLAAARKGRDAAAVAHASAHLVFLHDDDGAVVADRAPLAALLAVTGDYVRLGASVAGRNPVAYREDLFRVGAVSSADTCRQVPAASAAAMGYAADC